MIIYLLILTKNVYKIFNFIFNFINACLSNLSMLYYKLFNPQLCIFYVNTIPKIIKTNNYTNNIILINLLHTKYNCFANTKIFN